MSRSIAGQVSPAWGRMARRLFHTYRPLTALADRVWTVYPESERYAPPAIHLPGALDRVTATQHETTLDAELRRVAGGMQRHGATTAYRLPGVALHEGYLYCRDIKQPLEQRPESFGRPREVTCLDEGVLACSYVGNVYFGHTLTDDLPLALEAARLGTPVRTSKAYTPHQLAYQAAVGARAEACASARFRSLTVLDDAAQNDGKRERYLQMRARLLAGRAPRSAGTASPPAGLLLWRGASGVARQLLNEDLLRQRLEAIGFRTIDPERMTLEEIVDAVADAPIIVGVEGSQLAHALFAMPDSGSLITLQPPFRFNNVHKDYTDCLGLRYGFVIGQAAAGGFTVDVDDVLRTVALAA